MQGVVLGQRTDKDTELCSPHELVLFPACSLAASEQLGPLACCTPSFVCVWFSQILQESWIHSATAKPHPERVAIVDQ